MNVTDEVGNKERKSLDTCVV